ncbi:MAG: arsenate reductase [Steroidobacteraceae bacterium]|jgi:arsenate reductase|nr:arsenate reductase [Steroidobacteraceae bacterium]
MAAESNSVTIFHDALCANSRDTLGLIRNSGIEPTIVDYLRDPPTRLQLTELIGAAGLSVRAAMRKRGTRYHDLQLGDTVLTEAQLLDAMIGNPTLIKRPFVFVVTSRGTRWCRRPEQVLDILPGSQRGFFAKESGEIVIAANGERVCSRLR